MIIDDLPDGPDPVLDPPKIFSFKAAAMVLAMKKMVVQFRAAVANLTAWMTGGGYAIPYTWGTYATVGSAAGGLLVQDTGANQNATGYLYADIKASSGALVTQLLDEMDDSTSSIRGKLKIVSATDPGKFLYYDVIGATSGGTYLRALRVSCTNSSGANPFAVGEAVMMTFSRTGDKGDFGSGAMVLLSSANITSAVANIDFLNTFSSGYDKYVIEMEGLTMSANVIVSLMLAKGGVVDGGASYNFGTAGSSSSSVATTSHLATGNGTKHTGSTSILNALDGTANSRLIHSLSMTYNSGSTPVTQSINYTTCYTPTGVLSGFRLTAGASFTSGIVRVYGIKNS